MFAEDWLSLLRCQMPGYDVIPHLVDLLGLHVLLYMLKRGKGVGRTWQPCPTRPGDHRSPPHDDSRPGGRDLPD